MEKALNYLKRYKSDIDPIIEEVFTKLEQQADDISPIIKDVVQRYHAFMQGGKKHRGALTVFGYEIITGSYDKEVLKASLAIEITHAFALIHDDVMDQDDVRRTKPTIHKQYEHIHAATLNPDNNRHFAESMAYTVGDFGAYLGQILLNEADLPLEYKSKAITHYVNKIMEVTWGQILDLAIGIDQPATEKDVLLIHRYKTGDYSGSLPLMIGGMLAGADDAVLEAMFEYGWRIGTAYQLRDDEIGLFEETETIGKPAGSDIRQNKNTLLKVKAIENASSEDQQFLLATYGNPDLTPDAIEEVRAITIGTGALAHSQAICRDYVEEAKAYIEKITDNPAYQDILHDAAEFMILRDK